MMTIDDGGMEVYMVMGICRVSLACLLLFQLLLNERYIERSCLGSVPKMSESGLYLVHLLCKTGSR